ncbi:hypothetical protein KY285_018617 [Solanum tuberosum]|nr:hypothetical protein KY285_018617 [Solanum tuberosum]
MTDAEMMMMEEEKEMKVSGVREKMKEFDFMAYFYQTFNRTESPHWRNPKYSDQLNHFCYWVHVKSSPEYSSCKFPILPVIDGVVKPCSYSELENITNFETCLIQYTQSGRLFRGTITGGSEKRSDEIELYETANVHPHLAKLSRYCCDRRLAVVYDEELTTALSDVLPADDFGWDKRMNVATQLADLLAWLHKKKIAVGSIIASCIMIDKEVNIKVFDFGYICNRVNEDSVIPLKYVVGRYPEDVSKGGCWTMKSDVYIFGFLLVELITKTKLHSDPSVFDNCKPDSFVHKSFEDVDDQTVFGITSLACRCVSADPGERPTMKMVLDDLNNLNKLRKIEKKVEGKRKRDENESTIE